MIIVIVFSILLPACNSVDKPESSEKINSSTSPSVVKPDNTVKTTTLLPACNSLSKPESSEKINSSTPLPVVKPDNTVKITFIRNINFSRSACGTWPTLDGKDISGLMTGEYTKTISTAGTHKIGVRFWGGLKVFFWNHPQIDVNLKKNKEYFYLISSTIYSTMEIKEIAQEDALKRISKYKFISAGSNPR